MADSGKVRLVRCPKCQNLLPELADYSVYQCGGCGAVLRAKNKALVTEYLSEKSDDERAGGGSSKSEDLAEEVQVHLSGALDADVKPSNDPLVCDQRGLEEEYDEIDYLQRNRNQSKRETDKSAAINCLDVNLPRNDEVYDSKERKQGESISQIDRLSGAQRSGKMPQRRVGVQGKMEGSRRTTRGEMEGVRYSTLNRMDEGPSNYNASSSYSFGESVRSHDDPDGVHRVQYLEQDRVELLKKLDELKDQLSRSGTVADRPKEKVPLDRSMGPSDPYGNFHPWLPDASLGSSQASYGPDKHVRGQSYFNHFPEPFPYTNRHEMAMHGVHPSMLSYNHMPGYGDPYAPQILGRGSHQLHGHYQQQSSHPYMPEQYIDSNTSSFEPYPRNKIFHQPSCSCIQCYNKHHRAPLSGPPAAFGNKRFIDMPSNSTLYHNENLASFGPRIHNSRSSVPQQISRDPQAHTRWPSDMNAEMGGFVHYRPQKVVLANGGRRCRPIAGGAPFITCSNCFELLQVPKKVLGMVKKEQKIQCGACSTIMDFAIINKKLVLPIPGEAMNSPAEVDDLCNEVVNNGTSYSHEPIKRSNLTFSSDDFDNSGYEFQSLDRDSAPSTGHVIKSSKSQETQSFHSSSPSISEDEISPDILVASGDGAHSVQQPIQAARSPPPPGSPLQEHFEFSSNNHAVNRFGKGNRSSRSDHEKVMPNKIATRQNSVKEASLATEMEVSFNEYSNTGISQDSRDSREEDRPRTNKGGESFFANIIKKSFRDFSRSSQTAAGENGRSNVSVNGHPLSDRLVKKAEKLAGPIQPGDYWYDSRAGFWGIMGGPCLGIILPFIEEFNYPIPENCASGTSGVFVNGRELHQKDLELLASRGLPTDRDRSYIVEISGRVLDEETREELESLGRLAPTVEKVKHGFGMKPPKTVAEQRV